MKAMVRARLGLPPLELPSRHKRLICAKPAAWNLPSRTSSDVMLVAGRSIGHIGWDRR